MQAVDFKGLYAIIPTPAREGAQAFGARDTVDLAETERLVSALIRDGASGLIILGTTGECATLSTGDYRAFVDCVCKTVAGRIPLFAGATAMGAHEVRDRLEFAQAQGAEGTLLGLPMWQPCTLDMAVRFYAEAAEYFPKLPIMVYANARAFRFSFPTEFWARVAKAAPTVIASKASQPVNLAENIAATEGRVHFMPPEMVAAKFHEISPETTTSCWATAAGMGPAPAKAMIDAILAGDAARIRFLTERIAWTNETFMPMLSQPDLFASYNIQFEKMRMAEAGYCVPGPCRPPYDVFPEDHAEAARECGRRWKQLCRELVEETHQSEVLS